MPTAKLHALTILGALDEARSELVGKAVVLTDGKAGRVENVWLDELHGLRISIEGHHGKWPVSTIKLAESWTSHQLHVAQIERSFHSIPIKMKSPTSIRKVTLMIATVRNKSLAERGFMNASRLPKPRE